MVIRFILIGLLAVSMLSFDLNGQPKAIEYKANALNQKQKDFRSIWNGMNNRHKNGLLRAINEDTIDNDSMGEAAIADYADALVEDRDSDAVVIYLERLSADEQRDLLENKAGLSDRDTQRIIEIMGE